MFETEGNKLETTSSNRKGSPSLAWLGTMMSTRTEREVAYSKAEEKVDLIMNNNRNNQ